MESLESVPSSDHEPDYLTNKGVDLQTYLRQKVKRHF
jgi:hypothetical protein